MYLFQMKGPSFQTPPSVLLIDQNTEVSNHIFTFEVFAEKH